MNQAVVTQELKISDSIRNAKSEFANLLKASGTDIERFQNNALMAINSNADIAKGEVSSKSVFNVCSRAANDGVLLDGKEAALVIGWNGRTKSKEAQYRLMSAGLMKMINRSPDIEYISCQTVHENDICEISFVTDGVPVTHKPDLKKGRGEIIGAYVVARLKSGEWTSPEYMSAEEILAIRDAFSQKDKDGNYSKMWRDAFGEACKKTVLHRAIKRLPIGEAANISDDEVDLKDITPEPELVVDKPKRKTAAEKVKEAVATPTPTVIDNTVPEDTTDSDGVVFDDDDLPL